MTSPILAKTATGGGRVYQHPVSGVEVPSVTTILNVMDKPALPRWAALEVANYAVEHREAWESLPARDAVTLLKGAPWSKSKNAADAGTDAHAVMESLLKGEGMPPMTEGMFSATHGEAITNVRQLLEALKPLPVAVEATAWSHTFGYAGTFDALVLLDGDLTLVDLKTSKDVYPDYALQLAAYVYADAIVFPDGTEIPMPSVDRCQIWHCPKDGTWSAVDIRVSTAEQDAFLAALDIFKWKRDHSKTVVNKPKKARTK